VGVNNDILAHRAVNKRYILALYLLDNFCELYFALFELLLYEWGCMSPERPVVEFPHFMYDIWLKMSIIYRVKSLLTAVVNGPCNM